MSKRRKKKRGGFFIFVGLLCLLGAAGLLGYNMWDGYRAEEAAKDVYDLMVDEMSDSNQSNIEHHSIFDFEGREMPTITINGYRYVGYLSVPSENLNLPVMEEWDYTRLKIAPCRYTGSIYNDDMVIAGHNYWRHFSRLKWIKLGEKVDFTDVEGNVFHYVITNRQTLRPTMVSELVDDENEQWDLTLFTCNTGGQTRCVLRCERTDFEKVVK